MVGRKPVLRPFCASVIVACSISGTSVGSPSANLMTHCFTGNIEEGLGSCTPHGGRRARSSAFLLGRNRLVVQHLPDQLLHLIRVAERRQKDPAARGKYSSADVEMPSAPKPVVSGEVQILEQRTGARVCRCAGSPVHPHRSGRASSTAPRGNTFFLSGRNSSSMSGRSSLSEKAAPQPGVRISQRHPLSGADQIELADQHGMLRLSEQPEV